MSRPYALLRKYHTDGNTKGPRQSKVISARSSSTGYLVSVIQEREERGDSDIEEEPSSLRYGV